MTLNGKMALILRYFTEFGSFRGALRKVVDKAITIDNLRLLCLVVNVCRGTARRPRYKYSITARLKFCSRFPFRLCSSLVHSLPHLLLFITFFPFSPSYSLYIFSSIVHPIHFYQNRPTPFPGERS